MVVPPLSPAPSCLSRLLRKRGVALLENPQISTTGGVLGLMPLAYFLIESELFRIFFMGVGLIAFYCYREALFGEWIGDALDRIGRKTPENTK